MGLCCAADSPPSATRIALGSVHNLALAADGTVWAWGRNDDGQLGDGTTTDNRPAPVRVSGLTGVVAVAGGAAHSLALTSDGTLPPGLSYPVAVGDGWSCSAVDEVVTCTNPGPVNPGASSAITLTVLVEPQAWPGVTNLAVVTNATDWNVANNTMGDPTVVLWRPNVLPSTRLDARRR